MQYPILNNIQEAATLPGTFYHDELTFEQSKERIFARSWQLVAGAEDLVRAPYDAMPFRFMDHFMEEPLLLLRDKDSVLRCLSNVCTHRANILLEHPCKVDKGIVCRYHGRRFDNCGQFISMPETRSMLNFPTKDDDLTDIPLYHWRQFSFVSLAPAFSGEDMTAEMERKIGFLPVEEFRFAPERSRDYLVKAHWALYCDNYLEGFHIPFVHKSLASNLDWNAYRTELYPWSNCQVGIARGGEECFDLPPGHEDHGSEIAAYYFWLFPNIMFNFYPWGLSLNIVRPMQGNLTRVSFRAYVWKPDKLDSGAGAALDVVEREDEAIVEQVQVGSASRFYKRGRFSPDREQGVHHFHRLIAQMM